MKQQQVKTAQSKLSLKETHFENARLARLGVEVLRFSHLLNRTTVQTLCRPERVHFYMLMFVTAGIGDHTVDGVKSCLSAGSLVLVKPGQVQRWHVRQRYSAQIVLIDPVALNPAAISVACLAGLEDSPSCVRIPRAGTKILLAELAALRAEIDRFDQSELAATLIRYLLVALLLRVLRWSQAQTGRGRIRDPGRGIHRLFLNALESDFRKAHRVYYYARRLGYSTSTLNRACVAAEARSAKAIVDRRIALEAQRLLVHSHASYAAIGHHLGFSEATNFVKFFTRVVGRSPAAVRF